MDKVLILDSDEAFLNYLAEGLQKYKGQFEVFTAASKDAAFEILGGEPVSILVADGATSRSAGSTLLSSLEESHLRVPCIIMMGGDASVAESGKRKDLIIHSIRKPFSFNDLARTIIDELTSLDEGAFFNEFASDKDAGKGQDPRVGLRADLSEKKRESSL